MFYKCECVCLVYFYFYLYLCCDHHIHTCEFLCIFIERYEWHFKLVVTEIKFMTCSQHHHHPKMFLLHFSFPCLSNCHLYSSSWLLRIEFGILLSSPLPVCPTLDPTENPIGFTLTTVQLPTASRRYNKLLEATKL